MSALAISLITMGGLGAFFAAALAIADKKLRVEEDPRIGLVNDALPGANCGACGYAGCAAYAEAVATEGEAVDKCPVGGQDCIDDVARIMGVEASAAVKHVARLMCRGTSSLARTKADYEGPTDCAVQDLVSGGGKACQWGCLGGGDCVEVCNFGALEMGPDGLPVVFDDLFIQNKTQTWSVELMYIHRFKQFHHGGWMEFFAGGRYMEFDDTYNVAGKTLKRKMREEFKAD